MASGKRRYRFAQLVYPGMVLRQEDKLISRKIYIRFVLPEPDWMDPIIVYCYWFKRHKYWRYECVRFKELQTWYNAGCLWAEKRK